MQEVSDLAQRFFNFSVLRHESGKQIQVCNTGNQLYLFPFGERSTKFSPVTKRGGESDALCK